jgi:hypothetical protein
MRTVAVHAAERERLLVAEGLREANSSGTGGVLSWPGAGVTGTTLKDLSNETLGTWALQFPSA